jgi:hypothetical protein
MTTSAEADKSAFATRLNDTSLGRFRVCPRDIQRVLLPWFESVINGENRILRNIRRRVYLLTCAHVDSSVELHKQYLGANE